MFPYSTMAQPIFWMIMGLLIGLSILGLKYWLQDLKILMNWWKWTLLSIWLLLLVLSIGASFTLMGEGEWTAGRRFLLFFGVIVAILGSGLWKILKRK